MNKRTLASIIGAMIVLVVLIAIIVGGVGKNNAHQWQIVQGIRGKITVREEAGWYLKWFATVWTYPRYVDKTWNDIPFEGDRKEESIRTTFNDGGTAQISTFVRYETPQVETERVAFHRAFSGNIDSATAAVKSHLINCLKATGPLMSASENQSARKAEFTQLIWEQLKDGLYQMKRVTVETPVDQSAADIASGMVALKESKITTELLTDASGKPLLAQESPLKMYAIKIQQFSVTETEYDEETLEQFAAKKQSYLAAEQSKADREKEKQERLNVIEKGLREVATAQATANVVKEKAVVEAQQKAEVAEQAKIEAETKASMTLAVAKIAKEEAQVKLDTAELDAQAIEVLAQAERKKIELAGALTELEQAQIDAQVKMASDVANGLSKIQVPAIIMGSSGIDGKSFNLMENLINLKLMTDSGLFQKLGIDASLVKRTIDREIQGTAPLVVPK
jgi:hypothetical protein